MEAIREGVQDYEYFVMLKQQVERLTAARIENPLLTKARALLSSGPTRVTDALPPPIPMNRCWRSPRCACQCCSNCSMLFTGDLLDIGVLENDIYGEVYVRFSDMHHTLPDETSGL